MKATAVYKGVLKKPFTTITGKIYLAGTTLVLTRINDEEYTVHTVHDLKRTVLGLIKAEDLHSIRFFAYFIG